jgi:hypothetical protein
MTWWLRAHKRAPRRRNRMEEQLEKEVRFHLDQHTADLMAEGHDPWEARRQARLSLGGEEQVKEDCRDARGTRWLEDLWQDFHYAARTLWNAADGARDLRHYGFRAGGGRPVRELCTGPPRQPGRPGARVAARVI